MHFLFSLRFLYCVTVTCLWFGKLLGINIEVSGMACELLQTLHILDGKLSVDIECQTGPSLCCVSLH